MTASERSRYNPFGWQLGVAAKLYLLAGLSTTAVAILAAASIHFARVTESAATQLNQKGFEAVESSTRLQSLLAQHRQIVESAPAEVDRSRLEANQREYIAKSAELSALLNELSHRKMDQETEKTQAQIAAELPDLETAAQQVMFYAYNFAQDKALSRRLRMPRLRMTWKEEFVTTVFSKFAPPMMPYRPFAKCTVTRYLGIDKRSRCAFVDRSVRPNNHARGIKASKSHNDLHGSSGQGTGCGGCSLQRRP